MYIEFFIYYDWVDGRIEIEEQTGHIEQLLIDGVVHLVWEPVHSKKSQIFIILKMDNFLVKT